METDSVELQIPRQYRITDEVIKNLQILNHDLIIDFVRENGVIIKPKIPEFASHKYIDLKFPEGFFPSESFDELYETNDHRFRFEQVGEAIRIKMGFGSVIGLITMAIGASLYIWTKKTKLGRVRSDQSEFEFYNEETKVLEKRIPDVSYISFEKASEKEQKSWGTGKIKIAPTLSIEIVSSKYGLKPALWKMQHVWIRFGTDIGVVVCPFSKKLYIFEKGKSSHREQSIYQKFTHPLLPDYEGDFSEYVDEIPD
ncbi:MAG: Uma2 family endonuclease [Leptospiraceae bacterium]|nr:Uma2 family endonuclease [Leptospiraceae bacterium]MCP5502428.1 Uma2 family endonuclease [Leptospiraceae bacterium]